MKEPPKVAYKDLQVWQKSINFATDVIKMIDDLETDRKHYRLIEQLEAAATSIPMNIAEGKGRRSKKDFIRFLYISRGSIYETLTLLEIFLRQGWLTQEKYNILEKSAVEIIRMLKGLINALTISEKDNR